MAAHEWQIAIFGTFDVENYGDLLFPILAEAALSTRLGAVKLHKFSYHEKSASDWPYTVTSLTELPELACQLDAILIGGGFLIRFDKIVAANYAPPTPEIHHPTGYWLTPALIALQHGIPLIWNAPGMHCNDVPQWAKPLMTLALENSSHIAVRDSLSQAALVPYAKTTPIHVLPDTAFAIADLIDEQQLSAAFHRLRKSLGLTEPYIVIHAIHTVVPALQFIKRHRERFQHLRILVLPIGPVLGDHESIVGDDLPNAVVLPYWPQPVLLAEFISQAAAVIGHSYHLMITALAFGVPVFSSADLGVGKYTALAVYDTVYGWPAEPEIDPNWLLSRIGKTTVCDKVRHAHAEVVAHWDRVATIVQSGPHASQAAVNRFWQMLPNLLEESGGQTEGQSQVPRTKSV
ncbi:MAG: polysaccharide pyruvyl transferase family protein [Pseudomonadota bacterium]